MDSGLGFEVCDSRSEIQGQGFGIRGLAFGVRDSGSGIRVEFRFQDLGSWIQNLGSIT